MCNSTIGFGCIKSYTNCRPLYDILYTQIKTMVLDSTDKKISISSLQYVLQFLTSTPMMQKDLSDSFLNLHVNIKFNKFILLL